MIRLAWRTYRESAQALREADAIFQSTQESYAAAAQARIQARNWTRKCRKDLHMLIDEWAGYSDTPDEGSKA